MRGHQSRSNIAVHLPNGPLGIGLKDKAMKDKIHPDYHNIKVVMTDGTEYMTRSTYGQEGATLNLDIDPRTHPAWTGGHGGLVDRGGRVAKFKNRFAGLGV
jgi:large subunit ribosomal protein L31